jgi:uncharacterized protein YnzC (UPF0291/DUF896 family)
MKFATKLVLWVVLIAFFVTTVHPRLAEADVAFLPAPGTMVSLSPSFTPAFVRGIKVYKDNPFKFDFIIDAGDDKYSASDPAFKEVSKKLIAYFLASLTIPEKDMWVNLSPYEKERIVPETFGDTQMGKELLAQDYLLKQVTASLMYPEGDTGREFWKKIYTESLKRFGSLNIVVNTLNKVWIVPDRAVVFENATDNSVVVVESRLKVMLEEDYLAATQQKVDVKAANQQLSNDIIREVILPVLEKEINEGKNFAALRQVYHSLILGTWYKNNLKQSLLAQGYVDRNKTTGVDNEDKKVNQSIYEQYLKSYRKGVYSYIKEEVDPVSNAVVPKKYFSGGFEAKNMAQIVQVQAIKGPDAAMRVKDLLNRNMLLMSFGLAAAFATGTGTDANSKALPSMLDQPVTTQAAPAPAASVESATFKQGDTGFALFKNSKAVQSLEKATGKKLTINDFNKWVDAKVITVKDAKGNILDAPVWTKMQPGYQIGFNLSNMMGDENVKANTTAETKPANPVAVKPAVVKVPVVKQVKTTNTVQTEPVSNAKQNASYFRRRAKKP